MTEDTQVLVKNRKNSTVGYTIPEMGNLQRQFAPGAEKKVPFKELQALYWLAGGREIITNYLIIDSPEVLAALQVQVEPEYFYSDEDIKKIMVEGSLNQFLDMLDFSNDSTKESIKELAVTLPLNDVAKRKAIQEKLQFNVDGAIMVREAKFDGNAAPEENSVGTTKRRAAVPEVGQANSAPKRRYTVAAE